MSRPTLAQTICAVRTLWRYEGHGPLREACGADRDRVLASCTIVCTRCASWAQLLFPDGFAFQLTFRECKRTDPMSLDPGYYLDSAIPRTDEEKAAVLLELVEDVIDERTAANLRTLFEPAWGGDVEGLFPDPWADLFNAAEKALTPHLPPGHACGWVEGDWCVYEMDADEVAA